MVVRFEHMWTAIPTLLIPIAFVVLMMGVIKVWMVGAPVKKRPFPRYSLHVMKDLPSGKPPAPPDATKPQYPPPPSSSYTSKPRPVSSNVLPYMKPGHSAQMMRSGTTTPGGMSVYSLGGRSTASAPRQWQGKFL